MGSDQNETQKRFFSNKIKNRCAMFVTAMSNVVFSLGLFSALYGWSMSASDNSDWVDPESGDKIPSPKQLFGMLAVTVGMFAVITGLLGCLATRCKVCCVTAPFMLVSATVTVLMFGVAMTGLAAQNKPEMLKQVCYNPDAEEDKKQGDFPNLYKWAEKSYGANINNVMCTPQCPCNPGLDDVNKKLWDSYDNVELRKLNRVKQYSDLTVEEKNELHGASGQEESDWNYFAKVIPLKWKEGGGIGSFTTYASCFTSYLRDQWKIETAIEWPTEVKDYMPQWGACSADGNVQYAGGIPTYTEENQDACAAKCAAQSGCKNFQYCEKCGVEANAGKNECTVWANEASNLKGQSYDQQPLSVKVPTYCYTKATPEQTIWIGWVKQVWGDRKKFVGEKGGFQFFKLIEKNFDCAGLCWKPLFGVDRDISLGKVQKECMSPLIDELDHIFAPAIVCLITAWCLLLAFFGAMPLCRGFEPTEAIPDDNVEDNKYPGMPDQKPNEMAT